MIMWPMFALNATGWFTVILSAREPWLAIRARRSGSPAVAESPVPLR